MCAPRKSWLFVAQMPWLLSPASGPGSQSGIGRELAEVVQVRRGEFGGHHPYPYFAETLPSPSGLLTSQDPAQVVLQRLERLVVGAFVARQSTSLMR